MASPPGEARAAAGGRLPTSPLAAGCGLALRAGCGAGGEHLLVKVPGGAVVAGGLGTPGERVLGDVGEPPPQLGLVFVAEQHDVAAGGPADEAPDPAVDRLDPGGAPGIDGRVVEPDGRAVKSQR